MITNIGFQYDKAAKKWLGAFMIAVSPAAAAEAVESHKPLNADRAHYELLPLEEIERREQRNFDIGDLQAYAVYDLAADAIRDVINGERASPYDLPSNFDDGLYSVTDQGEKFKVIDPIKDVDWTEYYKAQKSAYVKAEKVPAGTSVDTIMADGHVETSNIAGPDGAYKVTNPDGEQYLLETEEFEKNYLPAEQEGIYIPNSEARKVLDIDKNIAFKAPWGEEMLIKKGGVLVHNGPGDVYGIQSDEFKNTYKPA